jgi:hypothetical protein
MTDIALSQADKQKIDQAEQYLIDAQHSDIDNEASYLGTHTLLKEIKAKKKEFDEMRKQLKKPVLEAGRVIEDFFRAPINFLSQAEQTHKANIVKYHKAQARLNDDINQKNAIKSKELTDNALAALKANDYDQYAELTLALSETQSNTLTLPKQKGVSLRDNWKGRVTDIAAVIQAVADKKIPPTVLKVDESALNQLARSIKNTVNYPGIEFYNDQIVSVKAE